MVLDPDLVMLMLNKKNNHNPFFNIYREYTPMVEEL